MDVDADYYYIQLVTSNRSYYSIIDPVIFTEDASMSLYINVVADMDATDTAYVTFNYAGGVQQTDIQTNTTSFSGFLVA